MKIIVYNHADQYALSRRQVETLRTVLPDAPWSQIAEFHLCDDSRRSEVLEYDSTSRIVYFSYRVKEKTRDVVEDAIRELLIGLHRIQAGSTFFVSMRPKQRESFGRLADDWLPKCRAVIDASGQ